MLNNKITELLHIQYPIIQAPKAGGIATSKLVAEVSNSGGLGSIWAGYMTPIPIREQLGLRHEDSILCIRGELVE